MRKLRLHLLCSAFALFGSVLCGTMALAQEPVRIVFMDPLSGPFASIGTSGLKQIQFAADYLFNSKGGILGGRMIEIVPLDNKQSPTDTQLQFARAVSEGIQIIFQGNSSAVANALNATVSRHNRRNPGQEVLQINYSAVDPVLTEDQCSFWHFRFDAHANMKLNVLPVPRQPQLDIIT
ncbi:MAG: ABC transporter substrate-binding protein [Gammaproteobacteria bacterium]|nr:ABC transporter substrate-binding protein [Gammaproteobacteria bacterium]